MRKYGRLLSAASLQLGLSCHCDAAAQPFGTQASAVRVSKGTEVGMRALWIAVVMLGATAAGCGGSGGNDFTVIIQSCFAECVLVYETPGGNETVRVSRDCGLEAEIGKPLPACAR